MLAPPLHNANLLLGPFLEVKYFHLSITRGFGHSLMATGYYLLPMVIVLMPVSYSTGALIQVQY